MKNMALRSKYASDLSTGKFFRAAALRFAKYQSLRVPVQSLAKSGQTHLHGDRSRHGARRHLLPDDLRKLRDSACS